MPIPQVAYFPQDNRDHKIEMVDLVQLSKRKSRLDHNPQQPHRVEFYVLIYIEEGAGKHFVDFTYHPFQAGDFIFIHKDQIQAFDLSHTLKGTAILFTTEFVEQLQAYMNFPLFSPYFLSDDKAPVFGPSKDVRLSCQNLLVELHQEAGRNENDNTILMSLFSVLIQLLGRARFQSDAVSVVKGRRRIDQFLTLVQQNYRQTRDAKDYARRLNMTYKTLNQICKAQTRKTAKQLIDGYVLLEAKRRLTLEEKSVQEIAFNMGFDDPSNFIKFFKRQSDRTPRQFQENSGS
ncbi:MAG: AraC family transcriptional regulator [Granulosicoccus sp.]|nr:AraC family transcriptional regulator [Granulosicoccus sp.]